MRILERTTNSTTPGPKNELGFFPDKYFSFRLCLLYRALQSISIYRLEIISESLYTVIHMMDDLTEEKGDIIWEYVILIQKTATY
jgi:hypothetical protein